MPSSEFDLFKSSVLTSGIEAAAATHLMERVPFLFKDDWELYRKWRRVLGEMVDVDPLNITIVGSAGIGFSLSPHKGFRSFSNKSDIDVAIISEHYFFLAWRALRKVNISFVQNPKDRQSIIDHRERHIYFGCVATDRVLKFLPFKQEWTKAMSAMAGEAPTEERDIKFRVYRDYDSLRSYHLNGLATLKATLQAA